MTDLTARSKGSNSDVGVLHDATLEAGAIDIDQNAYSAGLDRIYDVKGLANMHVEIENTGDTNGLTYKIEKARKNYNVITDLVDADFDEDVLGDTNVAFGVTSTQDVVDLSPESTAIRIRVKRQTSGNDTTMAGIVSVN